MEQPTPPLLTRSANWARNSVTLKLLSVGLLLGLLLIPTSMVESLISERASTRDAATEAISAQWGGAQLVLGPVLVLPYTALETNDGHTTEVTRYLSLLPDTLSSTGTLAPERRHRGIYEAVVYRAGLRVQGVFRAPPLADLGVAPSAVRWPEAFVALGISDLKGIRSGLALRWDGRARPFEPGLPTEAVLPFGSAPMLGTQVSEVQQVRASYSRGIETEAGGRGDAANGLQALVPLANEAALTQRHTFAFDLDLNGSTGLLQAPLGRQTTLHLSAP